MHLRLILDTHLQISELIISVVICQEFVGKSDGIKEIFADYLTNTLTG